MIPVNRLEETVILDFIHYVVANSMFGITAKPENKEKMSINWQGIRSNVRRACRRQGS
jgi:hypothetical protein